MHAVCEIVIPPGWDIGQSVKEVMEHYAELDDDGKLGSASWWDWFVIGGRFSGHKAEARIGHEKLQAFREELNRRKVTVSGLQCGKPELSPADQIPMVDALWREMCPGHGKRCILFDHARDQYGKSGIYDDDVCRVGNLPESLSCERLIVATPCWWGDDKGKKLEPVRHLATEYWNGTEHQKSDFDGLVKPALAKMMMEKAEGKGRMKQCDLTDDWLCITVDYHN